MIFQGGVPEGQNRAGNAESQERRPVLVIEDNPGIKELLTDILESGGYLVVALESALGAAEVVRRINPCAIILDLGLPYRSGASLLAEMKADPHTASIPVIVVSALPDTLTEDRRAMAAAILQKPLRPSVLLTALGAFVRKSE